MTGETLDVRCPRCGGRAAWEEPFDFLAGKRAADAPDEPALHRWGGWRVRERFPSVFPWRPPSGSSAILWSGPARSAPAGGGYRLRDHGVVRCPRCHLVEKHRLRWPADAFFQWPIRGDTLWARDAEHARVLLAYIGAAVRDPHRFGGYARGLQELPAVFLAGRNRELVTERIRSTLAALGMDAG